MGESQAKIEHVAWDNSPFAREDPGSDNEPENSRYAGERSRQIERDTSVLSNFRLGLCLMIYS